jgi:phage FluMu protein Com
MARNDIAAFADQNRIRKAERTNAAGDLRKARAMANVLAAQSAEMRAKGEAMIQQADKLLCESWNERMWSDGEPIDPSPTIDQAVNRGFAWLEIQCARCKTPSDVDLAAMKHPPTTFVHDLASRLRCRKSQHRSLVQAA